MQKFLIIQTAFLGDVVLATALIEKLREQYPSAQIDFLLRKGNEQLLKNHPYLHEVLVWNKKEKKYRHLMSMLREIRRRKYNAVINVQRFAATGFLTVFSGAQQKIGFDKNPWSALFTKSVRHTISSKDNYIHEVDRNQQLIEDITGPASAKPRLYPTTEDRENIKELQHQPYICIAPASVWFTKQYPVEKWIDLLNTIDHNYQVYLLGGPPDHELCERIRTGTSNKKVTNLASRLSYLQSAALQQSAVMNYVNDSAPMHFASAVNAPVTGIYCSTVPSFGFGPLSDSHYIVQTKEYLACKPCGLHGYKKCPLDHFKCAFTIETRQLAEVLL